MMVQNLNSHDICNNRIKIIHPFLVIFHELFDGLISNGKILTGDILFFPKFIFKVWVSSKQGAD